MASSIMYYLFRVLIGGAKELEEAPALQVVDGVSPNEPQLVLGQLRVPFFAKVRQK